MRSALNTIMPRIAREILLNETKIIHKTIHSHNKDMNFEHPKDKEQYLNLLFQKKTSNHSQIHAYCIMGNHVHELYTVNDQKRFSDFMRDHLSLYAQFFNKKYARRGRVTNERPKTRLVENDTHKINAVFYIHANALDIVQNVDDFEHSSHHLYAYGVVNSYTKNIALPEWYMNLGINSDLRAQIYRDMFDEYLFRRKLGKISA